MPYNDDLNNRNKVDRNKVESETSYEKRQQRQSKIGLIVLSIAVVAFVAGFIATLDNRNNQTMIPGSVLSTSALDGTNESSIAPAAGTSAANGIATNRSPESAINTTAASGNTTGTGVNSLPEATPAPSTVTTDTTTTVTGGPSATTATSGTTTPPITENPVTYTTEDSCRSATNGACRTTSGGWTSVNPAPDRTAVPEAVSPAAGDSSTDSNNAD